MAKHVTVFKMNVKDGKLDDLMTLMSGDANDARLRAAGWQASIVGKSKDNPNEVWVTVTWDTSDNYYKNAQSPDQDAAYRKMRAMLTADPEWHDCDLIDEQRAGIG